jgi:hypothetical protein
MAFTSVQVAAHMAAKDKGDDAGSEAEAKDKASAMVIAAARQLVAGRGWSRGAVVSYA